MPPSTRARTLAPPTPTMPSASGRPRAGPIPSPSGVSGGTTRTRTPGLVLCTHRYYDPSVGRWLTRDPMGYDGGVNLYGYCGNDPVDYSDSLGFFKFDRAKFVACMKDQLKHSGTPVLQECWTKEAIAEYLLDCGEDQLDHPGLEEFIKCMTQKFANCLMLKNLGKALGKIATCVRYATGIGPNPFPTPTPIRGVPPKHRHNPMRRPTPGGGGSRIRPALCEQ